MAQAVEEWYKQMPIITRSYLTAVIVTTVGCSLDVCASLSLSPSKLSRFRKVLMSFVKALIERLNLPFLLA